MIPDENVRNIIKTGKRVERLDLYARLNRPQTDILREVHRLSVRISRTNLHYSHSGMETLTHLAEADALDHRAILRLVDALVVI